jgi:hypothetical protein
MWTLAHGAAHMWANHKVTVTEANEAIADIDAVWFDPDRTASPVGASA